MNRRLWSLLLLLMWLALPLMALRYWLDWDRLPVNMATHFDAAGRANGWMSHEASLAFTLGFMTFVLVVFSLALYFARRRSAQRDVLGSAGFFLR